MTAPPLVVDARGVWFAYRPGEDILRGVELALACGTLTLLWGRNGSGKTTLGKILAGLFRPRKGEVVVAGAGRRRAPVAMVLADAGGTLLGETAAEDVRLGPALLKLPAAEVDRRTARALDFVGLAARRDTAVEELSLGEKKRVALAAAFALAPAALILDEPFAFLDDAEVERLWGYLSQARDEGVAVLILTGRAGYGRRCDVAFSLEDGVARAAPALLSP